MTDSKHNFIWLDVETTGIDPRLSGARLLEIAVVLAADDRDGDLSIVDEITIPLAATDEQLKAAWAPMSLRDVTYVHDMHTKNGLIVDCAASDVTVEDADEILFAWVQALTGQTKPRNLILAGFSVHFDRDWIRVHMPAFSSCLSHRVFDVSTLKQFGAIECPDWQPSGEPAHRALDDVRESLRGYAQFRDFMRGVRS